MRYSAPPLPPDEIAERLRVYFQEDPPIEALVARTDRERGRQARIEASEARVELAQWQRAMRGSSAR